MIFLLRNHIGYTNHTCLLEYQYETFGLPYDEIIQVTQIIHVMVSNFWKKFFLEITEVTPITLVAKIGNIRPF